MIQGVKFFGFDLRSRAQRRWMVAGFYLIVILFTGLALRKDHVVLWPMVTMTLSLGGILGGINSGGPIKQYTAWALPLDLGEELQQLELREKKQRGWVGSESEWDEREMHERDAAHFTAYRMLRCGLGTGALLYVLGLVWFAPWVESRSPVLLWVLVVVVLSLPQAVILWREPNAARD